MERDLPEPKPPSAARKDDTVIDWAASPGLVEYACALDVMNKRVQLISRNEAAELVWLLEHPPLYTAGTSAHSGDLLDPSRLPVHRTGRGGQFTYHGPGQRVVYLMLNLKRRGGDVRAFVRSLENWIIDVLAQLGVQGELRSDRIGIWVSRLGKGKGVEDKIAAIGLRVSKGITLHGLSLNVDPNLSHYDAIVPCGVTQHGVTSLAELGSHATMEVVDNVLHACFERQFGLTRTAADPSVAKQDGIALPVEGKHP